MGIYNNYKTITLPDIAIFFFFFLIKDIAIFSLVGRLRFSIEFKHIVALINKTQIILYFSKIFKFNAVICLNSIKEPNVPNLSNFT
jgi:hypothetical protein